MKASVSTNWCSNVSHYNNVAARNKFNRDTTIADHDVWIIKPYSIVYFNPVFTAVSRLNIQIQEGQFHSISWEKVINTADWVIIYWWKSRQCKFSGCTRCHNTSIFTCIKYISYVITVLLVVWIKFNWKQT